jgi:hypothetical protein
MENYKTIIVSALTALIVALGGLAAFGPSDGNDGKDGRDGRDGQEVQLGGATVVPYNDFSIGGLRTWTYKYPMATATTSVCSILSPAATSTLDLSKTAVVFTVSSTSASKITIAKGLNTTATTTQFGTTYSLAGNEQAVILASTTAAQDNLDINIFAPNTSLNVGMQGGVGTFSPTGFCTASFVELQLQ